MTGHFSHGSSPRVADTTLRTQEGLNGEMLLIRDARVLTLAEGGRPRRGRALAELGVVALGDVVVRGDRIVSVSSAQSGRRSERFDREIDASGRVLMPAFVDCHTHACWAGNRLDEWSERLRGASYLDILKRGGGIMSTVRAVRATSQEKLEELLLARLHQFLAGGTTTVEVKSGYGLTTQDELKMLRAIRGAAARWPGTVIPTALLGHAMDDEDPRQVDRTISDTLREVTREFPGAAVDAFCEKGAWSLEDTVNLLREARGAGHPVRVHADQFNAMGMVEEAVGLHAVSVDHLEASTEAGLRALALSSTIGVGLPICGLHLDGRYANLRTLVDLGGAVAIATNCNPGSAPTTSMALTISTATRHCGLTPAEAIAAATVNAASVLSLHDRGTIAAGQRADMILLEYHDERMLAYELGAAPVDVVVCAGRVME